MVATVARSTFWTNVQTLLSKTSAQTVTISGANPPESAGNVVANPKYLRATDFHLGDGSPCIDAGNATRVLDHDLINGVGRRARWSIAAPMNFRRAAAEPVARAGLGWRRRRKRGARWRSRRRRGSAGVGGGVAGSAGGAGGAAASGTGGRGGGGGTGGSALGVGAALLRAVRAAPLSAAWRRRRGRRRRRRGRRRRLGWDQRGRARCRGTRRRAERRRRRVRLRRGVGRRRTTGRRADGGRDRACSQTTSSPMQ